MNKLMHMNTYMRCLLVFGLLILIPVASAGIDQYTVNYNIPTGLSIVSFSPVSDPTTLQGTAQTFSIILNKTANLAWFVNGFQVQINTNTTMASYTNSTANVGVWNVSLIATDDTGTVSKTWNWTVTISNTNLLQNSGFENSTIISGIPDNWSKYPSTFSQTANLTYPEIGNDGGRAVGISETKTGYKQSMIQTIQSIIGNTNYTIEGYINTTNVVDPWGTQGAVIGIDWFSSSGYISSETIYLSGTNPWIDKSIMVTSPSGAIRANFFVGLFGTGKAMFDNVRLSKS